jgi:hypothetical protein
MEGTLAATDSWFLTPESQVSAHYGVARDGRIHQYVGESDTAFHAGASGSRGDGAGAHGAERSARRADDARCHGANRRA